MGIDRANNYSQADAVCARAADAKRFEPVE